MQFGIERVYGVATTIYFPLIDYGDVNDSYEATPVTFATGDTQISKDGATLANTGSNPAHIGKGVYKLALTAVEMQARVVVLAVIDSATKTWKDTMIEITTVQNASAEIKLSADQGAAIADYILRRQFTNAKGSSYGDTKNFRSLLGAVAKLTNKVDAASSPLQVYEDDDATVLGEQLFTTSGSANPMTVVDTV